MSRHAGMNQMLHKLHSEANHSESSNAKRHETAERRPHCCKECRVTSLPNPNRKSELVGGQRIETKKWESERFTPLIATTTVQQT